MPVEALKGRKVSKANKVSKVLKVTLDRQERADTSLQVASQTVQQVQLVHLT